MNLQELTTTNPPPLHIELHRHIQDGGILGQIIRHPLILSVPYHPMFNDLLNKSLEHRKQKLKESLEANDYARAIFLHERPFRLEAFMEYMFKLEHSEYWKTLIEIWIDSEAPGINKEVWLSLFNSDRPYRKQMMTKNERERLADMDDVITIYRGCLPKYKDGISWTKSITKAKMFSTRFFQKGKVFTATCNKSDVIAYKVSRSEQEIIINPGKVNFI